MIEKVNPMHPDKIADRIAGAIVDLAYKEEENPKIAVEVLIGHGVCHVITESSVILAVSDIENAVRRIAKNDKLFIDIVQVPQDTHLSNNQKDGFKCGDNGIFKGVPLTDNEKLISVIAQNIYYNYLCDGKYILTDDKLIVCQSNADTEILKEILEKDSPEKPKGLQVIVNPLGDWTGGTDVDTGATNRKLGSDMAQSITGGGLHGKDLSKADVSVNIYAFLKAQKTGKVVELYCAIGDDTIDGKPYSEIVEIARNYIKEKGGFEKFAEWGLY